jgi:asparagine synthase (glutamine-hydrolysing)
LPGIVGLITRIPRVIAEPQLLRMVDALRHESFYEAGTWIDESLGVYVGWIVRKGSLSDAMPLKNEQGDKVLVFAGEEFSEPGTARRLRDRGHTFDQQNASYLVHVAEEDPTFPKGLNGRFQGLLNDRTHGAVTLFNDRYGMQRLYYHEAKDTFYFAAEAKAILAVRPELRKADYRSLGEFVACGCVMENRTLFEGVYVLPSASAWLFLNGSLERKSSYFHPQEWEDQEPLDPESYYEQFREVFSHNLQRYFDGHERVGVSLTGGLDTRMILAWHNAPPDTVPCYTFGGMFHDCQDVQVSRRVARASQQTHRVIPVGQDFLSRFSHYAERAVYLTDGCVYVNRSADLYANQQARTIAPVRMTGNYGSEVLRWAPAFKPAKPTPGLFRHDFLSYVDQAGETYFTVAQGHPVSFAVFRQAPWHHYGLLGLEQTQICVRTPYLDNDLVRTVFRAPNAAITKDGSNNDICLRLIADGNATLGSIRTDRGLGGSRNGLYGAALRNALEFTFKAEYAYDYGMPQWMAQIDHFLAPLRLERIFLGRHKFCHFRVWYRDALSKYVREMLLDSRALTRPYLEPKVVEAMVQGHLNGNRNYTSEIHTVLTLELLHRLFLDPR